MKQFLLLDGGMGRELALRGAPFRQPEWSALALMEAPEAVAEVHQAYIDAGADIITTNSYAIVPFHIGEQRFLQQGQALASLAGELARQTVNKNLACHTQIAGSIPPLFGSYRPDLFNPQQFSAIAQPLIDGLSPYVDLWLAETQSAIIEPQMLKALLVHDSRPLWVSFTLQDEDLSLPVQLRSGELVEDAVIAMIELGVDSILFNCSQPEVISQALVVTKEVLNKHQASHIRFGAYANAFPPQPKEATANDGLDDIRTDLDPQAYLIWAKRWRQAGASIIGGCCGIGPEHISVLAQTFK